MQILTDLLPKIQHLGLWGNWVILLVATLESTAFIGLLIPGTTVIVLAGFLASQEIFEVGDVIWFVAIGGILGDAISYYLGRHGTHLFKAENKLFKLSHLEKGEAFFKRHGNKSVALARFIGPLRPIIPFIAGLSKMDVKKFFLFNILSGVSAAFFYVLLGYYFGNAWHQARHIIHRFEAGLFLILIILFVGYYLRTKIFNDRSK